MIHQKQAALIFYLFAYYCNKCINMLLFNSVINIMFLYVNRPHSENNEHREQLAQLLRRV